MTITFKKNPVDMKACAIYVAQLVREGVTFSIKDFPDIVEVTLKGGF